MEIKKQVGNINREQVAKVREAMLTENPNNIDNEDAENVDSRLWDMVESFGRERYSVWDLDERVQGFQGKDKWKCVRIPKISAEEGRGQVRVYRVDKKIRAVIGKVSSRVREALVYTCNASNRL